MRDTNIIDVEHRTTRRNDCVWGKIEERTHKHIQIHTSTTTSPTENEPKYIYIEREKIVKKNNNY